MLLELQNLGKSFGEHEVLHDVTAGVERGDRIGIIGANGTGKTTLLRILCGESLPDAGDAAFGTGVTTGYLEQNARLDPTLDVYATMKLVFTPALDAMQQMDKGGRGTLRRRADPPASGPSAAGAARPADFGRAYEPSRSGNNGMAGKLPEGLPRRGAGRQP